MSPPVKAPSPNGDSPEGEYGFINHWKETCKTRRSIPSVRFRTALYGCEHPDTQARIPLSIDIISETTARHAFEPPGTGCGYERWPGSHIASSSMEEEIMTTIYLSSMGKPIHCLHLNPHPVESLKYE